MNEDFTNVLPDFNGEVLATKPDNLICLRFIVLVQIILPFFIIIFCRS